MSVKSNKLDPSPVKPKATRIRPTKKIPVSGPKTVSTTPIPSRKETSARAAKEAKKVPKDESEDENEEDESEEDELESDEDNPKNQKKSNKTPAKKKATPKKSKVAKDESDEAKDSEEEETKGSKKKKKKPNHNWTEDQRVALLNFILDQISLGKGTDNGNLKGKGWTAVGAAMYKRFKIKFDNEQLKNQKGAVRKLYIDMEFLLGLSGFGWDEAAGMVTADEDTWDELIEAHPKRMFATLRKGRICWYNLAVELFDNSCANGATALLPGQAPPKRESEEGDHGQSISSGLSTNSIKRRKARTQEIDLDLESSDDDKVEVVKRANREPPKKRIRESKYNVLKSGVESIVEVLRGNSSQTNIKPDIKPVAAPEPQSEPKLTVRQAAIKLMASMFFGKVPVMDYVRYIQVVESEVNAEVFISLANTTDATVCTTWLNAASAAV
ncbi:hypothetical protein PSTG_00713 [Puccinia striiformis f. sp. tritici PST-78]|uniref:Myb/SANT-like domain-containing protein n=1 Tax=Puccinia striiformis f. sp. tritici PST-78 TaxID=1165861 RepID=A0A0L0W4J5_9BASI|nr:hypothetical protein PSTG_00713 [Puccinia striiformis f. sp. tritici PST-78]